MKLKMISQSVIWGLLMLMSAYFSNSVNSAEIILLILTAGWFMMFSQQTTPCRATNCLTRNRDDN